MSNLRPRIHPELRSLIEQKGFLFQAKQLHTGPVHVIVPTLMDENIAKLHALFKNLALDGLIYYAHKPNKSSAFVKQALKNGIRIDVASREELVSALAAGYRGADIGCTGAKNEQFLLLAVQHECLISIDSVAELESLARIARNTNRKPRVLIRISDPIPKDRKLKIRISRFGVSQDELGKIFELLKVHTIDLAGFHFHNDERSADVKAGFVSNILERLEEAYALGFSPTIIDIGGGLRTTQLEDFGEWESFLNDLEKALTTQTPTKTWRGYGFGMFLNDKGKISGREKIQGKYAHEDFGKVYSELFSTHTATERPIADIVRECMLSVMIEPGFALLQQCGVSLCTVVGTKTTSQGDTLVLIDGNMYNLSTQMNELLMDPILISKDTTTPPLSGYLAGNLCREEDILVKREITFQNTPQAGDVICFCNTAAYTSDFEDSSPHQHPKGVKYVAQKKSGVWELQGEDTYNPFIQS